MKFSIALPTDRVDAPEEFITADAVAEVASTVELLGLDALFVTDHPAPDDRWLSGGGHHALEPTVALSFAAAATSFVRLHTNIFVLAYRNPFLAAKALASLDVLSGGRLICGVAAGYLRPEFGALGVDFDRRNDLTDESIGVLRSAWSGHTVAGETGEWRARGVTQLPAPASMPPIWVGGNTDRAMKRAAEIGDGWSPFPTSSGLARAAKTTDLSSVAQLADRITRLRELRNSAGRTGDFDVCCGPFNLGGYFSGALPPSAMLDELGEMARAGVTWTTAIIPGLSLSEWSDRLEAFVAEIVVPLSSL